MAFQWLGKTVVLKGLRPSHSSLQDASHFFKKPARKGLLLQITAQLFTAEPTLPVLESLLKNLQLCLRFLKACLLFEIMSIAFHSRRALKQCVKGLTSIPIFRKMKLRKLLKNFWKLALLDQAKAHFHHLFY